MAAPVLVILLTLAAGCTTPSPATSCSGSSAGDFVIELDWEVAAGAPQGVAVSQVEITAKRVGPDNQYDWETSFATDENCIRFQLPSDGRYFLQVRADGDQPTCFFEGSDWIDVDSGLNHAERTIRYACND